ncbi:TIGR02391 family protein [Streptomyces hydrogenans]|uniref:TIGR02391 family protein n=1 Tax=Streptomyces hydrogenans TaxID=1873719 RepID=UPI0036BC5727
MRDRQVSDADEDALGVDQHPPHFPRGDLRLRRRDHRERPGGRADSGPGPARAAHQRPLGGRQGESPVPAPRGGTARRCRPPAGRGRLAEGCFAGIRNPPSHEDGLPKPPEDEALEQLAAISVLARRVDAATVER